MNITNLHGVSLPLAVWLLHDTYDYNPESNYISATSLLKSTKQIILSSRVQASDRESDVSDFIAARFGHAVHDAVERAWRENAEGAMKLLGYPERVATNLVVNPSGDFLSENPDTIPVWIERRATREIAGYKISGKLDMILDGRLFDFKTTSVYTYLKGSKDDDYAMQGSIYHWLNPELITDDYIYIQFIFTDWQKSMTKSDPNYPKIKMLEHPVKMHDHETTERFITSKINEIKRFKNEPEENIPACTDKELWRSEPKFKYYSDPEKAKDPTNRSTKNFDTLSDANAHKANAGKGVVVTVPGEVKACLYCPAYDICKQKDLYFNAE